MRAMEKAAALLSAILADCGENPLEVHARALSMPRSTAYRMVRVSIGNGLLAPCGDGRFVAALGLVRNAARMSPDRVLSAISRPVIRRLSRR
ncbi:hypothetical protein ABTN09_20230, partial [Acinetobacter baumannii]